MIRSVINSDFQIIRKRSAKSVRRPLKFSVRTRKKNKVLIFSIDECNSNLEITIVISGHVFTVKEGFDRIFFVYIEQTIRCFLALSGFKKLLADC